MTQGFAKSKVYASHDNRGYAYFDGVAGSKITTPAAAVHDITGDITVVVAVWAENFNPASAQTWISKWQPTGNQRSWTLQGTSTGPVFSYSPTGSGTQSRAATATITAAKGTLLLVKVEMDVDNGAGGHDVTFSTKATTPERVAFDAYDSAGWVQLGAVVTTAGVAAIFASSATPTVASNADDSAPFKGRVYAAVVKNGIGASASLATGVDFTDDQWSHGGPVGRGDTNLVWTFAGAAETRGIPSPRLRSKRDPALTNTAVAVNAAAGLLRGYNLFNPGTALAYVHFYDLAAASVVVGTTVPTLSIALPSTATGQVGDDIGPTEATAGVPFATALSMAATTTPTGSTAPGTALVVNIYHSSLT